MRQILLMVVILLLFSMFFNGCSERVKYVYIKSPCPKLQTYDLNLTPDKHFTIHYTVKDKNGTQ
jgi:hypothetical protein